jgi:hypothetical protein
LLDGGDSLREEELGCHSGDGKIVGQAVLHLIDVDAFKVASRDDARERQGGSVLVGLRLAEGQQFGEDFEPEKAGLVDDEQRLNLLVDEFLDPAANDASENGVGKTFGFHVHGGGQLVVGLQNGAACGGKPKRVVLGVMKPLEAKRSAVDIPAPTSPMRRLMAPRRRT